jgi:hypothetical protein
VTRLGNLPFTKKTLLDGCLGVEPRGMESISLKTSATWGGGHYGLKVSMIREYGQCPFCNYTLAFALQRAV